MTACGLVSLKLAGEWASTLLEGLTIDDIVLWLRSNVIVKPDDAAALHRAGVQPDEVGWTYEDRAQMTLAERLYRGWWTVERVVTEVEGRRQR